MRILVVEDEPSLAAALVDLLADEGFIAEHAATGSMAASRVAEADYDLVLLDLHLPDSHGATLLLSWRQQGKRMPVIVLSGELDLGPWEQVFYGEFDGRRRKRVLVKILGE